MITTKRSERSTHESPRAHAGMDHVPWPHDLAIEYRKRGFWNGQTLGRILDRALQSHPDHVAIVCGSTRISYRTLDERVGRLRSALFRLGLRAGDVVVVQLPNRREAIEIYLALFRLGAIPLMALPGHRRSEIEFFVRHAEARAYVSTDLLGDFDCRALARTLFERPNSPLRHVIIVGDAQEFVSFEDLESGGREIETTSESPETSGEPSSSGVALLQLSGGSTGTPKLIPRTHDDYFYSIRQSCRVCTFSQKTVYLVALPLAHNFPMSSPGFLGCLYAGGTVVLCQDASPDSVFSALIREQVTVVAAVPPLAWAWLESVRNRNVEFSALELLQVGGAKLSCEQAQELLAGFGCRLQQVFGMAEGLVCYTNVRGSLDEITSTQGRPMSEGDEVRVVDAEDKPVANGTPGHLLTRGPYTIRGYFRAARHNEKAFTSDGFYRTGDIVVRNDDGTLTVVGRSKHQINRGGEKVAPSELERHLGTHPKVSAVAVIGIPDPVMGERIAAFVVKRPLAELCREELTHHLKQRGVATFKLPDRFEFVQQLPKTGVGKVDVTELDRLGRTANDVRSILSEVLRTDAGQIDSTTNLLEWGMDSLQLMMLVERFRTHDATVSFGDLAENPTIGAFEKLLQSRSLQN